MCTRSLTIADHVYIVHVQWSLTVSIASGNFIFHRIHIPKCKIFVFIVFALKLCVVFHPFNMICACRYISWTSILAMIFLFIFPFQHLFWSYYVTTRAHFSHVRNLFHRIISENAYIHNSWNICCCCYCYASSFNLSCYLAQGYYKNVILFEFWVFPIQFISFLMCKPRFENNLILLQFIFDNFNDTFFGYSVRSSVRAGE